MDQLGPNSGGPDTPSCDNARLAGYIAVRKAIAAEENTPVSQESKRVVLMELWREFWNSLSPREKREVEKSERFALEMKSRKKR